MRQAIILCGGHAKRLRPYSYSLPKASLPFLNLPLMSLSWFYSENLKAKCFLLNSHLFPDQLNKTVNFLSKDSQKSKLLFESEPKGSAGTLYNLKKDLQKTKNFVYINGDSLFFPSKMSHIFDFEKIFSQSDLEALFFVTPCSQTDLKTPSSLNVKKAERIQSQTKQQDQTDVNFKRFLWCDENLNIKFVGSKEDLSIEQKHKLKAFSWTGLALFKSSLLDHLKENSFDLFQGFINPLLKKHKIKVYSDPLAVILEAGDRNSYFEAMNFCLNSLFLSDLSPKLTKKNKYLKTQSFNIETVKKILEECFNRFDPDDNRVGLKNGKVWSQKFKQAVLLPKSVRGLEFLKLNGPAVIGKDSYFFDQTVLNNSVLDSQVAFSGQLKKEILLNKKI